MRRDPGTIERALDHLSRRAAWSVSAITRRNVAEGVIYLVQGIDVRHQPAA